ncbi:MAG: multidrug effflux MFS transporter [Gammaproteobacteria bacterium]|jgi:DHA1 family bicyclomycin/chloramphenicol resistance-like MFS transporter|nr:multidrug effflux MFS transporter [Gammaproteobacteria bacterium]
MAHSSASLIFNQQFEHHLNPSTDQTEQPKAAAKNTLSKRVVVLLAATSALGPTAMQILLPAIPVIKEEFEVSAEVAQLTLSLSMLAIAVGTLAYGPLSDRYGRKPIMLVGLCITFLGSLFCYFAHSIDMLILGRIIQAFGGAVGLVLARAIVRDVYGPDQAARVIATLVMVMVVMPMLSPAVGGELMHRFGWESVFLVMSGLSLIIFVILQNALEETLAEPAPFDGVGAMLRNFLHLFRSRAFRGYALCVAFVSVVFFAFISAAPEIMISVLDRPATEYGYYFIMVPLGFMLGNSIARQFSHLGINRLITLGASLGVIGIVCAIGLQLIGLRHPLALFMPVALAVLGNGITLPNAQAAAINEFPQFAGTASGLTGFLQMAFSAVAAQLVAVIFNGTVYPLLTMMLLASLASLGFFLASTRVRSR